MTEQQSPPRRQARLYVNLRNGFMKTGGMVIDISQGGIELEMHDTAGMNFGDNVELHSEKLGYIDGMIQSVKPRKLAITFVRTSNNSAKVAAFLKNFHKN